MHRVLAGICGLNVDISPGDNNLVTITIEGDCGAEDIELAAKILCPLFFERLDLNLFGVMAFWVLCSSLLLSTLQT